MKARATVANVSMTSAGTEYLYEIPSGSRRFTIKLRDESNELQVCFIEGESATTYFNVPPGRSYTEEDVKARGMLYFRSPAASQVAEILTWK